MHKFAESQILWRVKTRCFFEGFMRRTTKKVRMHLRVFLGEHLIWNMRIEEKITLVAVENELFYKCKKECKGERPTY